MTVKKKSEAVHVVVDRECRKSAAEAVKAMFKERGLTASDCYVEFRKMIDGRPYDRTKSSAWQHGQQIVRDAMAVATFDLALGD